MGSIIMANKINFNNIIDYFHDGILHNLVYDNNKIVLSIESYYIDPDYALDIPLSNRHTITGSLILEEITKVLLFDEPVKTIDLKMNYARIEDFDFENNNILCLNIVCIDKKSYVENDYKQISIDFKKYLYINDPNIFNSMY